MTSVCEPKDLKPYYQQDGATIYIGDALNVLLMLQSDSVSCVVLDPPYSFEPLAVRGRDDGAAGTSGSPVMLFNESLRETARLLRDGGIAPILCQWRRLPDVSYLATLAGLRLTSCVAWVRNRVGTGGMFRSAWDPILVGSKGSPALVDKSAVPNVIECAPVICGEHPYEKSPELWTPFFRRIPLGIVLDPFAGVGASGVAAKLTGHRWIGVEVNERFCEIAATRLQQNALPLL